jgi:hypothetical protein
MQVDDKADGVTGVDDLERWLVESAAVRVFVCLWSDSITGVNL